MTYSVVDERELVHYRAGWNDCKSSSSEEF